MNYNKLAIESALWKSVLLTLSAMDSPEGEKKKKEPRNKLKERNHTTPKQNNCLLLEKWQVRHFMFNCKTHHILVADNKKGDRNRKDNKNYITSKPKSIIQFQFFF
eukprot:TRINITY_DN6513_c0_g2_i1.p1 TRINITY_DN6513_c0_g2~~TRINITY_DN6513_c0_g2_i1.p1  ORF type:complete len:106 (+),score=5.66 TRINITY_DN6513_c0_g2_i1:802-1119(+)